MTRIIFHKGEQSHFLKEILQGKRIGNDKLAEICRVSSRTIRDWRKEKFTLPEKALLQIHRELNIKIPLDVKYLPDYWYVIKGARKGALKRLEMYGPPGTLEGRKKGGKESQLRRKKDPEKYRLLGCNVRKKFSSLKKSRYLAEATGIILGDGGVTNYQLKIYLDRYTDREYAKYVQELFYRVFEEYPKEFDNKRDNTLVLILCGANLIDNLKSIGLDKGDKIKRQVDFPKWIWRKKEYQISCVRGLMDTDGGLYFHRHWSNGIKYRNLGLCFTSWSKPLLLSVAKVLDRYNFKFSIDDNQRIYIYDLGEIKKYFNIIGTNNPKIRKKLEYHEKHDKVIIAGN